MFTLSPYFHYNNAHYLGGPQDTPFILNDNTRSNYFGRALRSASAEEAHNARVGVEVWGQHDNTFFGLTANPGGNVSESDRKRNGPTPTRCFWKINTRRRHG